MSRYILALDVGGTFTDLVCYDTQTGDLGTVKSSSTPPDYIQGMLDAIAGTGVRPEEVKFIKFGTTIATNTIIMRTGARTALITTAGFTDVLHAARAARPNLYDSDWDPAPPLVSRRDTLTVQERVTYEGEVLEGLDEDGLRDLAAILRDRGVEAVAISFLHSYINGSHERRAREILAAELPDVYTSISSEILPEIREFERTSTTVANAYLGPVIHRYLTNLLGRLESWGYRGPVLITHSGGGFMSVESARHLPARLCQSGPAAGVVTGARIGVATERANIITLDVGGTSADVSIIPAGRPLVRAEWKIEFNIPIHFPSVDVVSIGAGGGSIAWVDDGGVLKVGPGSAGARPGPACYGRGGIEPTVTDANLILGRLGSGTRLGGQFGLRTELAEQAMDRVAEPLGYSRVEAAAGILRIMRANMAGALRLMSVQRGYDPREFALAAFGGAGPLHAVELARELGIPEVVLPYAPGLGSAMGVLFVDVRHDFVQSIFGTSTRLNTDEINRAFADLEEQAMIRLREEGVPDQQMVIRRMLDVRYYGQVSGGLTLPVKRGALTDEDVRDVFVAFRSRYLQEYGYVLPEDLADLEIVNARAVAEGPQEAAVDPIFRHKPVAEPEPAAIRPVFFAPDGWVDTPVFRREVLPQGYQVEGPAIIEQLDTTTVLPPQSRARVDDRLNLICQVR